MLLRTKLAPDSQRLSTSPGLSSFRGDFWLELGSDRICVPCSYWCLQCMFNYNTLKFLAGDVFWHCLGFLVKGGYGHGIRSSLPVGGYNSPKLAMTQASHDVPRWNSYHPRSESRNHWIHVPGVPKDSEKYQSWGGH